MAVKMRGGVMSTNGTAAIEIDMRHLLRAKKSGLSDVNKKTDNDCSPLVFQISDRTVEEINHLIAGLEGVREKLIKDGDWLQREIRQYDAFSQSIVQLTNIVSEGMATLNKNGGPGD
jgi:hypothetical protein